MKKLKLLFAACALLVSAGVQAQKDVTSQYIKNATLSNGTAEWTVSHFNAPQSGNFNSNNRYSYNTKGYASEAYSGWGSFDPNTTPYYLKQTITLPAGHYTLVNYSFYREGESYNTDVNTSCAKLFAGSDEVYIKTLGSITAAGYANSQAEGAIVFDSKMYRNAVDFTIDADNTQIEIGLTGTFEVMRSWCIAGMFELINNDIPATMDAPFDVTGYITNPGFEYRDMTGWEQTPSGFFSTQKNNQTFKTGEYFAEKWQPSSNGALGEGSFSQTLENLPAGFYKLTVNLGGNGTYVSLNGKTANWEADKDYTVGYVLSENENLTITAGKTAEGTANWIHFDNFRLQFCGDVAAALTTLCAEVTNYESKLSASDYATLQNAVNGYNKNYSDVDELLAAIDAVQALYDAADLYVEFATALDAAQAIDQIAPMNADVLSALQTALATQVTMQSTAAEVVAATNALQTATSNANTSIANYAEAKAILDAANSYDATGQASYAVDETIAAIQAAYDDNTLTAVTPEKKAAAQTALATACKAQIEIANNSDMTVCIVNPNIDGNANGWTTEKKGKTDGTGGPMKPSNDAMEYWGASTTKDGDSEKGFDYYQTITGLPNGAYTIGASLLNSTNGEEGADWNGGGNAGVYGKTATDEVIALVYTDGEAFTPYTTDKILVVDGELRIGVKNINPLTGRWFAADNFKLTYVRQLNEKETAQILYNAAFEAAKAIEEGTIPSTAYSNLQNVITNNTLTGEDAEQYNAATTALSEATAAAQLLMDPYAAWKALKAQADALVAVSTNNTKENAALASDIDTQNTAAEAATTVDAIGNATTTLKTAMVTYATTAEPTNEECFDITFMIENPHFTEGEGGWGKVASGWTLESGSITEHRLLTHNFEAYHTQFNLSQTISGLQKGTYKVTLQGFARHDNNGPTDKTNLYCGIVDQKIKDINDEYSENPLTSGKPAMGDNNGEAGANGVYRPNGMSGSYYYFQEINPKTNQPFYTNEVQTLITEAGDLKIGFKCETGTDWVIWDNFHLYYYGSAIAVELDEATGSSYTDDIENANVTLKKTIYQGWNTITVPFAAEAADFAGEKLYKFTGDDETELKFTEATSIEPNVPYLLKATTATNGVGEFKFNGVTVKAADELTTTGTNYNFVGTYADLTVADGDYILGDDAFYRSNGGNHVKAYRAYIQKKSGDNNARLTIFIDGKATAIDAIDGEAIDNADIYNLAGQKVKSAQKGVYIQNGKKFVVK